MMATLNDSDCGHSTQGLIVISCDTNTKNNEFIKKILRHSDRTTNQSEEYIPKSLSFGTDTNIDGYGLKIDNKYYSADIFLFDIKDKDIFSERLADSVNGVLLYFDSNEGSSFDDIVQSWLSFTNQFDNEIKLLICQTIDDNKSEEINKWCLENQFELIEICPQIDKNQELEDDFQDVDGMKRILDAIQAHHWPHSSLKVEPKYNPSNEFKSLIEKEVLNSNDVQQRADSEDPTHLLEDIQQIEDIENFNNLFEKFSEMKVKSSQINETERKDYAEKVTLAFWNAIGGDINEIEELQDDSQSNQ